MGVGKARRGLHPHGLLQGTMAVCQVDIGR